MSSIKIHNQFIEHIFEKYENDEDVLNFNLVGSSEKCTYGKKIVFYEMIRIQINCNIDELKDIFNTIQSKTFYDEKNDVTLSMYLNNQNKDCWRLSKIFNDHTYFMTIEIYRSGFKIFDRDDNGIIHLYLDSFFIA